MVFVRNLLSVLALGLAFHSSAGAESVGILSDFDDTIQITASHDKSSTIENSIHRKAFAGMATLYEAVLREWPETREAFAVVTGAPSFSQNIALRFMEREGFPAPRPFFRDWIRQRDMIRFKHQSIDRVMGMKPDAYRPEAWIFIGDDQQHDPEIYVDASKRHPGRIRASYIRRVRGRSLPPTVIPFYTAFEIAEAEAVAGRLPADEVVNVAWLTLGGADEEIIPDFAECPAPENRVPVRLHGDVNIEKARRALRERLDRICDNR